MVFRFNGVSDIEEMYLMQIEMFCSEIVIKDEC